MSFCGLDFTIDDYSDSNNLSLLEERTSENSRTACFINLRLEGWSASCSIFKSLILSQFMDGVFVILA